MYYRGEIPKGEVIGSEKTYVGNEFNGSQQTNYLVNSDGTEWVCFAVGGQEFTCYSNLELPFVKVAYERMANKP